MRWLLGFGASVLLILGIATTALAAPPDGSTAATAVALPASLSTSGTLTGSNAGSFAFYTFNYPGNNTIGTLVLNASPTDSNTTNAVGVNLYQNGSTILARNALGSTSGSNFGTFSSSSAGPVLVEVYNYLPGQTATYNFAITGLSANSTSASSSTAAPTPVAVSSSADGKTANSAFALPSSMSASGSIVGNGSGAFTFYTFNYPGNNRVATLVLNVTPTDSNTTNAVGINIYQNGAGLLGRNALGSTSGSNSGTFSSPDAGPVLVEVYNYLPGQTANYNFAITGLTH